ncbi:MAG: hypothetical protein A2406_02410 [Candidatus Komeilibacteria bacterium RIFOXYC1_FULL_37_11]|uniref:O-antigen ligase-related domain-containing protein n=1 Tax=Candidatus Komeilibacteria bacterium RIFOXYC1_FULL_37_11 TaxID=1798555 RepID=A0A1G2BZQ3_9BACT|nr:MAG: hypothetical protein A2406_02410 [Candidatus Komeilibacteria bacterium RIFOXYC1_FULL_37_11]OGY95492.1 MAG: hypothetical protein A2611_02215 [Candidatus Komeilibacteria bacterium RIFOXYD1_FULL_37_29]
MSLFSKIKESSLFSRWLMVFITLEALSALAWFYPYISGAVLLFVAVLTVFLLFKQPIFSLYLPVAEIFWGSLGHSFDYYFINTRLLIFMLVVFVFIIKHIKQFKNIKLFKNRNLFLIFFSLVFLILLGVVLGYVRSKDLGRVFLDANAYFYIFYLPIWYQVYEERYLQNILTILKTATLIVAIKTILLLNIFSQNYSFLNIDNIYKWVRDTRTGEITPFRDSFFRIFMQSQFYLIVAWLVIFIEQINNFKNKNSFWLSIVLSSAIFISLSRSFWLGLTVGLLFTLGHFIYQTKRISLNIFISLAVMFLASILLVELAYNLPAYKSFNIFTQRSTDVSESAASTRAQLWGPLWQNIAERPIFGHGFGQEISFYSNDPRIKTVDNPSGWHTTYAFEWGWMDQLVKGGLVLFLFFVAWIVYLYRRTYRFLSNEPVISLALMATLTSLIIIHIFTPYLNHPLGLSVLMLASIIFIPYAQKTTNSDH